MTEKSKPICFKKIKKFDIQFKNKQGNIFKSIQAATKYLSDHINKFGKYSYIIDITGNCTTEKYNLLRHAGTTMELYRLVGTEFDDGTLSAKVNSSLYYLLKYIKPININGRSYICIAENDIAKLGGTALTILALSASIEIDKKKFDSKALIEKLGEYIVSQQRKDGSFVSKIKVSTAVAYEFTSDYYPGEAIYALCLAYKITQRPQFLESAVLGAFFLINARSIDGAFSATKIDHWLMRGLAELHFLSSNTAWIKHLRQLTSSLIEISGLEDAVSEGAPHWLVDASTTSIATRLEGLLAALKVELSLNHISNFSRIMEFVKAGMLICLSRQIRYGLSKPLDLSYVGGFINFPSSTKIRIDYVQHTMSAAITLREINSKIINHFGSDYFNKKLILDHSKNSKIEPTSNEYYVSTKYILRKIGKINELNKLILNYTNESLASNNTGMLWTRNFQIIYHEGYSFLNNGITKTRPTHDLSHIFVALSNNLIWNPSDIKNNREAEFNAVFLENILDGIYNSSITNKIKREELLNRTINHAHWFVENHYTPFPLTTEASIKKFLIGINVDSILKYCGIFLSMKKDENENPERNQFFSTNLCPCEEDTGYLLHQNFNIAIFQMQFANFIDELKNIYF